MGGGWSQRERERASIHANTHMHARARARTHTHTHTHTQVARNEGNKYGAIYRRLSLQDSLAKSKTAA